MIDSLLRRRIGAHLTRAGLSVLWLGLLCALIAAPRIAHAGQDSYARGNDGMGRACGSTYHVKAGDTLTQIAQHYRLSTDELVKLNDLKNPDHIYAGQGLCIPPHGMSDEQLYGSVEWSEDEEDDADDKYKYGYDGYDMKRRGDMQGDMKREMSHEAMYGSVEWSEDDEDDADDTYKYGYDGYDMKRRGDMQGGMQGGMSGPDMSHEAMYGSVEWSEGDDDDDMNGYAKPYKR